MLTKVLNIFDDLTAATEKYSEKLSPSLSVEALWMNGHNSLFLTWQNACAPKLDYKIKKIFMTKILVSSSRNNHGKWKLRSPLIIQVVK